MRNYRKLKETFHEGEAQVRAAIDNINVMAKDAERVSKVARDAHIIIADLDRQFEQATKLTKLDIKFLFLGVALQVVRQYFFTNFKIRADDTTAAAPWKEKEKSIFGEASNEKKKELRETLHKWYNPSLDEVTFNPVPFDGQFGGGKDGFGIFSLPKEVEEMYATKSPKGMRHRNATLGHDPILGWIFGTANIATATLTDWTFQSYHVKYSPKADGILTPKIINHADTLKMFNYVEDKFLHQGLEGKMIVAVALIREALHLKSDQHSFASLPIPFTTLKSPKFAEHLASYGLDMANIGNIANVGKQAAGAFLINSIIAMLHALLCDGGNDDMHCSLYEVRTRKILSYSNLIASGSNLLAVAIGTVRGFATENECLIKKSLSYLDIGGFMVTIYRLITDHKFIQQIKQEFLEKEFYNIVMGDEYNF